MIKIEHTLFALPFAFLGAVLAVRGLPAWDKILWIVVAMVGARSAAMAFNRLVDREFDAANPRTRMRAIPAGLLSARFVILFTIVSAAVFFLAAFMLNRLTLILSPIALASVLFYSYTKRFTSLSHLVLGWCLSIAPTGAWIAVRGAIDSPAPLLLSLAVMLWTAGFDIIYACQDRDFDLQAGLHSIPQKLGVSRALWISRGLHATMFVALTLIYFLTGLHWIGLLGIISTAGLLIYQHRLVRADDLSRLNMAFFTTNAYVSLILFVTIAADVFLLK
ncbi:putative 4-hydroxybenzoate polyprenyltransferase [candidate division KSB1 bacterium]|nr:putative 4-hydroxybenzoate polyprenyltransferase [candidate division KSB1 bacterium]